MVARIGLTSSKVDSSPPTITVRVPAAASAIPLPTGESIMRQPRATTSAATLRVTVGSMVLISTMIPPGLSPSITPSLPRMTCSTWGELGTMVHTTSEALATSFGEAAALAPSDANSSTGALTMS